MTEPLSPAAQAVLDAVAAQMEGGWISPDFLPYERKKLAAALRAAADQVVPKDVDPSGDWTDKDEVRHQLLAIAAELEGLNG
jgi:hypothetical protein